MTAKPKLYKVTGANGESIHGGTHGWSLPTAKRKGAWVEVKGSLRLCERGLHLTATPIAWWVKGSRVFEAEYDGKIMTGDDKSCVQKARLVREVPWSDFQVFDSGSHTVKGGRAIAYGSATVEASDFATVRASGSATVRASGSATVRASDFATVEASDFATVRASDSATVRASDSATVEAYGSATVRASGSATVTSPKYYGSPAVTLANGTEAVWIDRRGAAVVVTVAAK